MRIEQTRPLRGRTPHPQRSTTKNRKEELMGLVSAEIILENPREPNR